MSTIATKKNQINLYVCNDNPITKKTIALAKSSKAEVFIIDICKDKLTGTEWKELAAKANIDVSDFIQIDHPIFKEIYGEKVSISEDDAIKILNSNPQVFVYPIALRENKAVHCTTETKILELHHSDTGEVPIP